MRHSKQVMLMLHGALFILYIYIYLERTYSTTQSVRWRSLELSSGLGLERHVNDSHRDNHVSYFPTQQAWYWRLWLINSYSLTHLINTHFKLIWVFAEKKYKITVMHHFPKKSVVCHRGCVLWYSWLQQSDLLKMLEILHKLDIFNV